MEKDKRHSEKRILEKTLDQLYIEKRAPVKGFFVLALIYLACTFSVSIVAKSQSSISINGIEIGIYTFAGVTTSLVNIFAILLTLYYGKKGFFTALIVLVLQLPIVSRASLFFNCCCSQSGKQQNIFIRIRNGHQVVCRKEFQNL